MHSLLARQLRRHFGANFSPPVEWRDFIAAVNTAYEQSDADRIMLERSLELSSQELIDSHRLEKESLIREELRLIDAERQRLKMLADAVPAGVMRLGEQQECDFVNPEWVRLTGLSIADCADCGWWNSIHPLDQKMMSDLYVKLIKDGTSISCEYRIQTKATRDLWVYCTAVAEKKNTDGQSGWIFCIVDCTERKKSLKEIERSQRLQSIGVLAGGISHDLNNALAPIVAGLDLFSDQLTENDKKIVEIIGSSATRSSEMVRNLLTFARGVEGEKTNTDVCALVHELAKVIHATFPKNIELLLGLANDVPCVLGNSTQIHQVLLNLAVNSRDAMPEGGNLFIEVCPTSVDSSHKSNLRALAPGDYVRITVSDTGQGMSSEVQDRIFEPFFTTKGAELGTGLGLSTVVGIVQNHNGDISVYSTVGRGTTFHVYLPAHGKRTNDTPVGSKNATVDGRQRLILLVDDEINVRAVCSAVLQTLHFRVAEAANGIEALRLLDEIKSELACVITDMHMPGLDGAGLIRNLRHILPGIPVIAMSGRIEQSEVNELKTLRVTAIIEKPFTLKTLCASLAKLDEAL